MPRRIAGAAALAALTCPAVAVAQEPQRDPSIANLSRPGYEPRNIRTGGVVIAPTLDVQATLNDNIFATPDRRESDVVFTVAPAADARWTDGRSDIRGRAYANLYRYAQNGRENVTEFGASADGRQSFGSRQTANAHLAFDRTFQRRSDPEADFDRARKPALINVIDTSLDYKYQGSRLGIVASAGLTKIDWLQADNADRDLVTYRGSIRASLPIGDRINGFVQGYINQREPRLKRDRAGVDRTATTYGVLAGVSFDLTDRLQGDVGLGVFRTNPGDIALPAYTGIAANGRLVWRPRVRTAVTAELFRGDVATIRIGAIGRIDTRLAVAVDQEVLHNLIWRGSAGYRDIHYRGGFDQDQTYLTASTETQYLLNRLVRLFAAVDYTHRASEQRSNRFEQWRLTGGVRLAY